MVGSWCVGGSSPSIATVFKGVKEWSGWKLILIICQMMRSYALTLNQKRMALKRSYLVICQMMGLVQTSLLVWRTVHII